MFMKWMALRPLWEAEGADGGGSGSGADTGAGDGGNPDGASGPGAGGEPGAGGSDPGFKVAVDGKAPADPAAGAPADDDKAKGEAGTDEGVKDEGKKDGEGEEKKPEEFPHKPEDYTFTLPDGAAPDAAQAQEFAQFAVENKVPPEQAQKLVDFYAKTLQERVIKPWVDQVNAWGEATKTDPEYGGADYEKNMATANRALAEFGTPELGQAAREHGWGNHPEFVRVMYRVGRALGAPRAEKGGESGNPGTSIGLAEGLYGGGK